MSLPKEFTVGSPEGGGNLPALGFGTFSPNSVPIPDIKDAVVYALRQGIQYIDTAFMYGSGDAEKAVGLALSEWEGQRRDVWLTTKLSVLLNLLASDKTYDTVCGRANCHHSPKDVAGAAALSMKNLDVEYSSCP